MLPWKNAAQGLRFSSSKESAAEDEVQLPVREEVLLSTVTHPTKPKGIHISHGAHFQRLLIIHPQIGFVNRGEEQKSSIASSCDSSSLIQQHG